MQLLTRGQKGNPVMFFIHGWPDTGELWPAQLQYFSRTHYCVAVTLPSFAEDNESSVAPPMGYDFPELVALLIIEIDRQARANGQSAVVLVGHDWGAYLSYLIEQKRPDLVEKLITMDIGGHFAPSSIGHALFMMSYQLWLIIGFFAGKIIPSLGNWMTAFMSETVRAPRGPDVTFKMNYLYFYMWRGLLFSNYRSSLLLSYRPKKPILYLYGLKKRYHFHSTRWIRILGEIPDAKVVAVEGCDHWLMIKGHAVVNKAMSEFL